MRMNHSRHQTSFSAAEIPPPPLFPADMNNGIATRRSQTREISSRYKSPTPRRTPSPNVRRTGTSSSTVSSQKRAVSVERKRPSTPPSPSTPLEDTSTAFLLASRKLIGNRLPEALWPSTMRSLSVSFQSDTFSLPISKREKPVSQALSDRTLRPSSNVVHKQSEAPPASRKPTPERKRSPLKGKNSADHSENSKPVVDTSNSRVLDQHRWPSRAGGKVSSSNALNRSIDLSNKNSRTIPLPSGSGPPSLRRYSLDGVTKPLQKSSSDLLSQISADESRQGSFRVHSLDDNSLLKQKERTRFLSPSARSRPLLAPASRPASPNKASTLSSSRGISPSPTRAVSSASSRAPSPSRVRPSSPSRQTKTSTSVLSFITDIKGKKAAYHIEDAHQLRLLYNRHLQWRYANALVDAVLHSQKVKAKKMLHNVWRSTSELWGSVIKKRVEFQQLRLKLKLYSVLNEQLSYLDEWASIERDHTSSLLQAIQDLQACTLRLPITGGARGDIETVKVAVCSAVDMMQAMGSSICSVLSQVEGTSNLVSELADVAAQERAMLDECESLLASTAALQVEEYSIRSHLMQLEQATRCEQLIQPGN
nr:AUGMIN subunit 8 [Ipomoea batatas]